MKFNTKLLNLIVNFYGHLSNQMHPLNRTAGGYFHLVVNIIFNFLFLYYLTQDLYRIAPQIAFLDTFKPVLSMLIKFFLYYAQQLILVANFLFSLWYGPQMTYCLNSSLFNSVPFFNDGPKIKLFFAVFIIAEILLFIASSKDQIVYYFNLGGAFSVIGIIVFFSFTTNTYFHLHLLLYWQYGTIVILRQLQKPQQLQSISLEKLIHRVRSIALINDRFYSLLSFPLASFLFVIIFGSIATISAFSAGIIRNWVNLLEMSYPFTTWVYIVVLVKLNEKILKDFDHLMVVCLTANDTRKMFATEARIVQLYYTKNDNLLNKKAKIWCKVRVHELKRKYRDCFQLRLFGMIKINNYFLLSSTLFVLNLVVFLVQTK